MPVISVTVFLILQAITIIIYIVTGFCSQETITSEDTVYLWQETIGGTNTTFQCPNNQVTVTRLCEAGGQWQSFDETACSNTSFCRRDIVQRPGSLYIWPETLSNSNASIRCPTNPEFSVSRECSPDGEWQPFDETACGIVIQLLSGLNNSFTNVSISYWQG